MNTHLARVFYQNWLKKPVDVLNLSPEASFDGELDRLDCQVHPEPRELLLVKAVVKLDGLDADPKDTLFRARAHLYKDGVFFLRTTDGQPTLDDMLELLFKYPIYKIAETYVINGNRDYLLVPIPHKPKVVIGMIAKNEERDLPRCLKSLEGVADGICLIDTGSTDKTMELAEQWAESQGFDVQLAQVIQYTGASEKDEKGDWKLWNFSKARNQYVKTIENMQADYVLWMDADDQLLDKKIKNLCFLDQYIMHGVQIESGGLKWPHHRLWKTGHKVKYSGWCHEYPDWGGQTAIVHPDIAIYHDAAPGAHENSNDRNLRILKKQMEKEPSPRTAFYLANTYKDRGLNAEAAVAYQKRLDYGKGYEDEYWFAVLYKARCERASKQFDAARSTLLYAIKERADWAEFFMELSYLESDLGRHEKAIGWALQAADIPQPPTQLWREKDKYTDQPYRTISWAYQHLKEYDQAVKWAERAKVKIGKPDDDWDNRIGFLKRMSDQPTNQAPSKRRVVWHRPGAIGDVLMTLDFVGLYKKENPNDHIIYKAAPAIASMLKPIMLEAGIDEVRTTAEQFPLDRQIDLIGYPLHEGHPSKPMAQHLIKYFSQELGLGGRYEDLKLKLPKRSIKPQYITLHATSGWSMYKNWPLDRWAWVCGELKKNGVRVVQIGGPEEKAVEGVEFNRLGLPFTDSLALLANAKMHIGIDSWSNHATNIVWEGKGKVPGVILWGSSQSTALGYPQNKNLELGLPCQPCFREDPKISRIPRGVCPNPGGQTYENPQHACMFGLKQEYVLEEILKVWKSLQGQ